MSFPERDWKQLRSIQEVALDRYCKRVLGECDAIVRDTTRSAHERYIEMFRLMRDRDRALAGAFDDLRRSTALQRLAAIVQLELLADADLHQFSPETRESAIALAQILSSRTGAPSRFRRTQPNDR
jgi:hypothetical protein